MVLINDIFLFDKAFRITVINFYDFLVFSDHIS